MSTESKETEQLKNTYCLFNRFILFAGSTNEEEAKLVTEVVSGMENLKDTFPEITEIISYLKEALSKKSFYNSEAFILLNSAFDKFVKILQEKKIFKDDTILESTF